MPDLLELAARCEAAEGPDRDLDALLHFATSGKWAGRFPSWPPETIKHSAGEQSLIEGRGYIYGDTVPFLTASIDDALALVPAGHTWTLYANGCAGVCPKLDEDDLANGDIWAATPALALCAAALRARKERG